MKANVAEFSVSELAQAVKRALESGFGHVRLRGEISGYRGPHSSGHCYFSLKDENAKIDAVVWRGVFSALRFKPSEGLEVVATGKITTYPNSSKYQIVIESLEPAGVGALMALLEERIGESPNAVIPLSPILNELAKHERYLALETKGRRYPLDVRYGLLTAQLALGLSGADREEVLTGLCELLAQRQLGKGN